MIFIEGLQTGICHVTGAFASVSWKESEKSRSLPAAGRPRCAPFLRQGKRDDTRFALAATCSDPLKDATKPVLQRLKPLRFCCVHAVAKATAYKDSRVLTRTLKPLTEARRYKCDFAGEILVEV